MATDSTGADISSSIVVVDVTPCAAGAQCPACAITFAAAGLCQPGPYLYLYRSANCIHMLSDRTNDLVHTQQGTMPMLTPSVALQLIPVQLVRCSQGLSMTVADQTASAPPADFMLDSLAASLAQHTLFFTMQIACSLTAVFLSVQGQGQLCLAGISMAAGAGAATVRCRPLLAPHAPGSRLSCCSGPGQHPDYWQERHQPHCFCCCCWSHFR